MAGVTAGSSAARQEDRLEIEAAGATAGSAALTETERRDLREIADEKNGAEKAPDSGNTPEKN